MGRGGSPPRTAILGEENLRENPIGGRGSKKACDSLSPVVGCQAFFVRNVFRLVRGKGYERRK